MPAGLMQVSRSGKKIKPVGVGQSPTGTRPGRPRRSPSPRPEAFQVPIPDRHPDDGDHPTVTAVGVSRSGLVSALLGVGTPRQPAQAAFWQAQTVRADQIAARELPAGPGSV